MGRYAGGASFLLGGFVAVFSWRLFRVVEFEIRGKGLHDWQRFSNGGACASEPFE
jgi:hypothetical protein